MNAIRRRNEGYNPMTEFDRLRNEMSRLFDDDWLTGFPGAAGRLAVPAVDVCENENDVEVRAELPGVEMKDVDVSVSANVLTIRGEKKGTDEKKAGDYYHRESWQGTFQRTITLPDTVNPDKVDAKMKDGVLRLTFPKKEEVKPRQISIKAG
ncbi:MAG: Hsp20/alpha crystallin family protein [bacterium]